MMAMTENYYHQGWIYGPPTCVILHATRSGQQDFDHLQELTATVGWFQNPESYASAHWVISPTDAVRMVPDEYPSWTTGWHSWQGYGIEITQPLWNTPFEDGHYTNIVRVCAGYVRQGIPIRRIEYLSYSSKEEGFVQHQDTEQGIAAGKSDLGIMFDWGRFFAELRNEVKDIVAHEVTDMKLIKVQGRDAIYRTDGRVRQTIVAGTLGDEKRLWGPVNKVSQAYLDTLKVVY
jgi:N-acetyl-anhydromuramyl-L-alanine amidase AmpD